MTDSTSADTSPADSPPEEEAVEAPVVEEIPPTPPVLDVDIAELSKRHRAGESPALVLAGYWVRLADHEDVEDRFVGHIAAVLDSPWKSVPFADDDQEGAIHGYRFNKDQLFRVQTRDEVNAILELPFEAFSEVAESRSGLLNHA